MKKGTLILMAASLALLLILVGCSNGADENEAATPPAQTADEAGTQLAAAHDCDGGCGMTAVPMDKLTQINGKYYCQGCAAKVTAEAAADTGAAQPGIEHE